MRWVGLVGALVACGGPPSPAITDTGTVPAPVDRDRDGYVVDEDCDDLDPNSHPGGVEVCDGADNDCNGEVDDGITELPTWYYDADGDGRGGTEHSVQRCAAPAGFVRSSDDCDDDNVRVFPGAKEICHDLIDNDCVPGTPSCALVGEVDGPFPALLTEGLGSSTRFVDVDGDGHLDVLFGTGDTALRLGPAGQLGPVLWGHDGALIEVGDLDGDGHLDALLSVSARGPQVVWGPLAVEAPEIGFLLPGRTISLALDANGDGALDLIGRQEDQVEGEYGVWFGPLPRERLTRSPDLVVRNVVGLNATTGNIAGGPGDELLLSVSADGGGRQVVLLALDAPVIDARSDAIRAGATLLSVGDLDGDGHDEVCEQVGSLARVTRGPLAEGETSTVLLEVEQGVCFRASAEHVDGDDHVDLVMMGEVAPMVFLGPFAGGDPSREPDIQIQAHLVNGALAFEDLDGDGVEDWLVAATPFSDASRSVTAFIIDGTGK